MDAACPAESQELAALCLSAAASLGDVEAVQRWSREAPPAAAAPPLFDPDGPVIASPSDAEARAGYDRAVAAYEAGSFAAAGSLALPVGAARGALAGNAFVLAARSAERKGDAPRAARMWARAHRVACKTREVCTLRWPEEDLFGLTARYGRYVPWYGMQLCTSGLTGHTIVNGTWQISSWSSGFEIHEIPSRVLLDHVDVDVSLGAEAGNVSPFCLSRDGKRRVGVVHDHATNKDTIVFGARGGPLARAPAMASTYLFAPSPRDTYVSSDGGALFNEGRVLWMFDPANARLRRVPASPTAPSAIVSEGDIGYLAGSLGERGYFYAYSPGPFPPAKGLEAGVLRYDLATGKGSFAYAGKLGDYDAMGPADEQGRFLAYDDDHLLWVDGPAGKVLAEMKNPSHRLSPGQVDYIGVVPPSTIVWLDPREHLVYAANVAAGTVETESLFWHPDTSSNRRNLDEVTRTLGELPLGLRTEGSPPQKWSALRGWSVGRPWGPGVTIDVAGKERGLDVLLTADWRGALVRAPDGRFELIGEVPDAFRASASCGRVQDGTHGLPSAGDPIWPVEVCGAALEEPGLVRAWLAAGDAAPSSHDAGAAPASREDVP